MCPNQARTKHVRQKLHERSKPTDEAIDIEKDREVIRNNSDSVYLECHKTICYKFVSDPQPFYMAEEQCQTYGGHLVSVENGFENAMLAVISMDYLLWVYLDQPDSTSQCSVELLNGTWISVNCATSRPYVCAIVHDFGPTVCPTCPALPTCPSAPSECFLYFLWATFDDAETVCVSNGGSDLTWIGLQQANYPQDTKWTWTDGTPVDYMKWAPGQPDNAKGLEHCGQDPAKDTSYQKWNDIACTTEMRAYVCKKPASH
ncbi:unnamed protein product [Nippostrongylus brasiliensis]|uniref:C-type lectin domain-containing protein n=1 Tax=Nippostrongylus brasiliensis TaxID=27835 RepID=A0A0N4YEI8_NIPBR|nr:unnamed protein product [Nippostrongylus brasiliensis]